MKHIQCKVHTVVLNVPVEEGFCESGHNSKQNSYHIEGYILQYGRNRTIISFMAHQVMQC